MKTPDEIKKALECCFNAAQCGDCPYYPTTCDRELVRDAREYIRHLEAENAQLLEKVDRFSKVAFEQNMVILGKQDIITKQERRRVNYETEIWQLKQQIPRWIPVEERLPVEYAQVLVHVKHNETNELFSDWECIMTDVFLGDGWADNADSDMHVVTHWMPLPEAPKGGE